MSDKRAEQGRAVPSGRLSRMARLGSMTAGVAGNMALGSLAQLGRGQRPAARDLLLTPRNITRITAELARMRGAAMKMGQLISMDTGDVLPPELAQIMARLRDDAQFMPPKQLREVLNAAWGNGWLKHFKHFDVRPIAAASIGQVHRATTRAGATLAIKVQYPGVAQSIDSDVANVGALIKMSGLLPKGFSLDPYLEDAKAQLHEETDYAAEAASLARFRDCLADDPRFLVPRWHPEWSSPSVLAMDYVASQPIEAMEQADQPLRDQLAHDLIDLVLREMFELGHMQTDPNFANYRYQEDSGRVVLLDFGATRALPSQVVADYRALLIAGLARDREGLLAAAHRIGFLDDTVAKRHRDQMARMMSMVFEALLAAPRYDFASPALNLAMQEAGVALAEDGFVPPPVPLDVLLVQRKLGGMFLLAARLKARVAVVELMERWL